MTPKQKPQVENKIQHMKKAEEENLPRQFIFLRIKI